MHTCMCQLRLLVLSSVYCPLALRFPISKPQLANQWVQSLGMKNFIPTPNTCLCSEHFNPDCFRDYNGKQFLREDAVPTIFGADSSKVMCGFIVAPSSFAYCLLFFIQLDYKMLKDLC